MPTALQKIDRLAGITALFLIITGAVQIYLGEFVSKSVALTANGFDCVGDGFISGIVWVGLKYFNRPANEKFHYGYYKLENLASIVAAFIMVILASYITYRSYNQWIDPHEVELPLVGIGVALFAGLGSLLLGYLKYQAGKELNLPSLELEVFNTFKDASASFLAVIGLVLSSAGYPLADAVVGFVIAIIILIIGFEAIKEASLLLMDACDDDCNNNRQLVVNLARSMEGVHDARVVRLRYAGPSILGELELEVDPEMTVTQLAKLAGELKEELQATISNIQDLAISAVPHRDGGSEKS